MYIYIPKIIIMGGSSCLDTEEEEDKSDDNSRLVKTNLHTKDDPSYDDHDHHQGSEDCTNLKASISL